jgi:hypothetical protein
MGDEKLLWIERDPDADPDQVLAEPTPEPAVKPGLDVYDLATDSGEQAPLRPEDSGRHAELSAALRRHFDGEVVLRESVDVDEALRDRLRALGYLE